MIQRKCLNTFYDLLFTSPYKQLKQTNIENQFSFHVKMVIIPVLTGKGPASQSIVSPRAAGAAQRSRR
jgi:hypothetical protein